MKRLIYLLALLTVVMLGLLALAFSGRLVTTVRLSAHGEASASRQYRCYLPCVARQWGGAMPTPMPSPTPSPTPQPRWVWETVTLPPGDFDGPFDAWDDLVFIGMRQDDVQHTYRSEDRGVTWKEIDWSPTSGIIGRQFWFSPSFGEDHTVFGASSSLARSTDAGRTWARRDTGFTISYIDDLSFAPDYRYPNGTICLHTGTVNGHRHIYCSTNNGDYWNRMIDDFSQQPSYCGGMEMLSEQEGVLLVCHWMTPEGEQWHYEAEVWYTEDGWASWEVASGFPKDGERLVYAPTDGLLAGTRAWDLTGETLASGIWQSLDEGRTWQLFPCQLDGHWLSVDARNGLVVARADDWDSHSGAWYELTEAGWRVIRDNEPDVNVSFRIAGRDLVYFIHRPIDSPLIIQRGVRTR